jgi:hypothetical protein
MIIFEFRFTKFKALRMIRIKKFEGSP